MESPEVVKKISDNSFALGKKAGMEEVVKELKEHYVYGVAISKLLEVDEIWRLKIKEWGIEK